MILVKTVAGLQAMKDRSVALSARQRSAFILFDGKRTVDEVLAATAPTGLTPGELDQLVELGLLVDPAERALADTVPMDLTESVRQQGRPIQQRYADAHPIAIQLTSGMGLRGARMNLAVESADSYEQLIAIAPRIRDAVGLEKYLPLALALHDA